MTVAPVLILAHRRPDLVRQVMRSVAHARPERLFLACDGPRPGRPGEPEKVEETRHAMERAVTWDCDVSTRFSDVNLGCREGVQSAIDWFFANVPEGIILEDDCVPHPDFFPFCTELLARYRADESVMHISGDGSLPYPRVASEASYAFSREALVWGWASWATAWVEYDRDLRGWEEIRTDPVAVARVFPDPAAARSWSRILDDLLLRGTPDSWAYRWSFSVFANEGVAVVPRSNLVSNIGHREDSTHTFDSNHPRASVPALALGDIRHPEEVRIDPRADLEFQRRLRGFGRSAGPASLRSAVRRRARSVVRNRVGRLVRWIGRAGRRSVGAE